MNEQEVFQLLACAAQQTLETMFFTMPDVVSTGTERPVGLLIAASLTFEGSPPGRFGAILSEPVGRSMAANFLGAEPWGLCRQRHQSVNTWRATIVKIPPAINVANAINTVSKLAIRITKV